MRCPVSHRTWLLENCGANVCHSLRLFWRGSLPFVPPSLLLQKCTQQTHRTFTCTHTHTPTKTQYHTWRLVRVKNLCSLLGHAATDGSTFRASVVETRLSRWTQSVTGSVHGKRQATCCTSPFSEKTSFHMQVDSKIGLNRVGGASPNRSFLWFLWFCCVCCVSQKHSRHELGSPAIDHVSKNLAESRNRSYNCFFDGLLHQRTGFCK